MIHSLYILNKAGGLIYQQDYSQKLNRLSINDYLVFAGTIHGVHAIASKLTPHQVNEFSEPITNTSLLNPNTKFNNQELLNSGNNISYSKLNSNFFYKNNNKTGLKTIETNHFKLTIYQTLTGLKLILISDPKPNKDSTTASSLYSNAEEDYEDILRNVYIIYSDYVMKNPFYSLDMPIKAELFDIKVKQLIEASV